MKKFNLKPLAVVICMAGIFSQPVFAKKIDEASELRQINKRAQYLESEMEHLKKRLHNVSTHKYRTSKSTSKKHALDIPPAEVPDQIDPHMEGVSTKFESKEILEFGAMPVVTSPYIGIQSRYDASNLVVNIPPYNDDVRLLKQRAMMHMALAAKGLPMMVHPLTILSGKVIGAMNWNKNYEGHHASNINLNDVEFDVTVHVNTWMTGLMVFNYDNSPLTTGFVNATANSRIFLNKGFITVGDLDRSPFYGTIGQRFLPFGRYASAAVTVPLITNIGSTLARSLLFGYQHLDDAGAYAGVYAFNGTTLISARYNINRYGATAGYQYGGLWIKDFDFGVDAINNISDSQGMQNTGASVNFNQFNGPVGFTGFGESVATENLQRRVPGLDFHGKFSIFKHIVAHLEYLTATHTFNPLDMTFNGSGAKPRGMQLEGVYLFRVLHRPASFALSYQKTWESLALNIPRERYLAAVNISLLRNTIQSIEFHRDMNYATTDTASGASSAVFTTSGRTANRVLVHFGIYF